MAIRSLLLLVGCCSGFAPLCVAQSAFSMKQTVQLAKAGNPVLKSAHYNIGIAEADVITSKLRPNPTLNNQTLQLVNSSYYPSGTEFYHPVNRQVWWQLTRQFRLPEQRRSGINLSTQSVLLEQKNYADLERNLAFEVSNQWLNSWMLGLKLVLYDEAQQNIDSLVKINELRLKSKVITSTDLIRTKLVSEQYRLQTRNARQNYINSLKDLRFLMGRTDSVAVDLTDSSDVFDLSSVSLDSLISYGHTRRTDLLTAMQSVTVSESQIRFQKSQAYPVPELGMIWNPQNTIPYVGFFGTLQIPLFSRNQGLIARSKVQQQQSLQEVQRVTQQIDTEIQTAYLQYQTQRENLTRFKVILTESETVLNSVRYSYLKGGTTIVDFLEAQRSWFDTRQLYLDAVLSYRKSYIDILFASGLIYQLFE